jgi:hypothetical protein
MAHVRAAARNAHAATFSPAAPTFLTCIPRNDATAGWRM